MAVQSSQSKSSKSFYRNKHLEYRRKYFDSKDFSKKLDQASAQKTPESPEKTPKTELSEKSTPAKPQVSKDTLATAKQTQKATVREPFQATQASSPKYSTFSEAHRSRMQRKLAAYKPYIKAAAARYDLPEELIAGVIWQESRGNPRAVSHCGAMGLMQLMPSTARHLGVSNAFHPAQNIDGGAKYLRQMLDKFGRVDYAVAAYNAGPGNVQKHGGIPPFRETRDYVPKVLGGAQSFKVAGGFQDDQVPTAVRV